MTYPNATPQAQSLTPGGEKRDAIQRALGLTGPDRELDGFASELASKAGTPYAMINIFGEQGQQFHGLCTPGEDSELPTVGRSMSLDDGFCPEVVNRRNALILPDVFAHPRFAGNAVVDLINIRTYAGVPLIWEGTVLGTVCFVGPVEQPQSAGQSSLALVREYRDQVMDFLARRAGYQP